MWLILGSIFFSLILYYLFIKPARYWRNLGIKQCNLFKHIYYNYIVLMLPQSAATVTMNLYNEFPDKRYYGFHQLNYPALLIRDLDLLKQIMIKEFDSFADHRFILPKESDPLFRGNLATLTGEDWKTMRSILSPTFTANKMKFLFELMNECGKKFVKYFRDGPENVNELEMQEIYTKFCSDVIASSIFGVEVNTLEDPNNEFFIHGRSLTDFLPLRKKIKFLLCLGCPSLYKLLKLRFIDEEDANFFIGLVADSVKQRKEKGIVRPDMIHLLMEAQKENERGEGKKVTSEDIVTHAVTFFFAGFDPVSRLMSFASHELAENVDVQDKLRQEIRSTLKKYDNKLSYDGLMGMKYMDMVINETLRKYPTQVATDRVCTKPFTIQPATPDEITLNVPVKTGITIPTFAIHRDPDLFPNPERFDPERFSDENKSSIKPSSFQPFGMGPRNCIGNRFAIMETKIILFNILNEFEFVPVKRTKIPLVLLRSMFSLSAEGGFWLGLKKLT